jgi:transcription elongation factor Elf1
MLLCPFCGSDDISTRTITAWGSLSAVCGECEATGFRGGASESWQWADASGVLQREAS